MKKIFAFGTGRCGTVTLNRLFQSMPNTFSMHEGIFKKNGSEVRVGDMKEIGKFLYYQEPKNKLEIKKKMNKLFSTRDNLILECSEAYDIYCDVNPYSHPMIRYIYNKHPDAYFIHLIRDGYDVVNSYHLRTKTTYPLDVKEKDYRGYQSGKPRPLKSDKFYSNWSNFDRVQKISWFWQKVNQDIESSFELIPKSQKLVLKLENLNENSFRKALKFMDINKSFNSAIINKKYNSSNTKLEWTKDNIVKFNKVAAPTMRHFKYEVKY